MSLINQMLRDLESGEADAPGTRGRVRAVGEPGSGRRPGWLPVLTGLVVLLVAGAALAYWVLQSSRPTAEQAPVAEPPLEAMPVDLAAEESAPSPRLLAIERVETRDGQRLRLDFDGDSGHRRRAGAPGELHLDLAARIPEGLEEALPPGVHALRVEARDDADRQRLVLVFEDGWSGGPLYADTAPGGGDRLWLSLDRPSRERAEDTAHEDTTRAPSGASLRETHAQVEDALPTAGDEQATASPSRPAPEEAEQVAESTESTADAVMTRERRQRSDQERAAGAWDDARAAINEGDRRQAERHLEEALRLDPLHVPARDALAELRADAGRVEDADLLLAETLDLDGLPRSELAYFARQRARLWHAQGQTQRAIEALSEVYPERDDELDSGALLAGLLYQAERPDEAADEYERLLARDDDRGAWWMGLGLAREALGEPDRALSAYENALSGDGLGPSVREYLRERIRELESGQ